MAKRKAFVKNGAPLQTTVNAPAPATGGGAGQAPAPSPGETVLNSCVPYSPLF